VVVIRPVLLAVLLAVGTDPVPGPAAIAAAEHLAIEGVSSNQFESHPTFDPVAGDLYFVRSTPQFTGWKILRRPCTAAGRGPAEPFRFGSDGVEADPFFTRDGRRLYFISSRPDPPAKTGQDLDIWYVERRRSGAWGKPVRLPAPVNSAAEEWFPRIGPAGALYFGSGRPGGFGETDIYVARHQGGTWNVANMGGDISTAADDYEFEPSHDGRLAVLMSDGLLYRFDRSGPGWGPRKPLLPGAEGFHVGPLLSPSGRTLLFARGKPGLSGELFRLGLGEGEPWPPSCPRKRRLR
jgi:WD40-like Beta Propeller Repeat